MFQFLLGITSAEHSFVDFGAFNLFPMTSADFLSGLEKGVMLKSCNKCPTILLTQMTKEISKESEDLPLLMHLIALSTGSELYADMF